MGCGRAEQPPIPLPLLRPSPRWPLPQNPAWAGFSFSLGTSDLNFPVWSKFATTTEKCEHEPFVEPDFLCMVLAAQIVGQNLCAPFGGPSTCILT